MSTIAVMASYWLEEREEPLPRAALAGVPEVEIVGGGVTGCSCALALAQAGVRVRLHEAREIAGGASGRNGGFALRGGAMAYDAARKQLGHDSARAYWQLTEQAQARLATLAGDAFRALGSLRLAVDDAERDSAARGVRGARRGRVRGRVARHVRARSAARGRFAAALLHPGDGAIQPARWVRSLARRASEAGAELRENSRVGSLDELEAERVVVATDGLGHGLVPELDARVRATRGQVLVTESLPKLMFERPHYARYGLDYWHQTRDRRLVIGGSRDAGGDREWTDEETVTDAVQSGIEALALELLGRAPRVTHRWAGIWGTTEDLLPLVGQVPGSERVWLAAGTPATGTCSASRRGELVARALGGDRDPLLDVLDPARAVVAG